MITEFTVNKQQATYMLDVTERSMTNWQNRKEDPLPIKDKGKRGQSNSYDPQELVRWKVRQAVGKLTVNENGDLVDYEAERARLTKEQADGQSLKNAVTRRELAPVDMLEYALSNISEQVNSILESIPLKVKNRLPTLTAAEVEIIGREIIKAQNAASKVQLDFDRLEDFD